MHRTDPGPPLDAADRWSVVAVAVGIAAMSVGLWPSAVAAADPAPTSAPVSAAAWLLDEAADGVLSTNGSPDPGLMADTAIAAAAAHHPGGARVVEQLTALGPQWIAPAPGVELAGSIAKLAVAADVWGRDVTDLGGTNLRDRLLARLRTAPDPQAGRFSNLGTTDNTNVFTQSFGIVALARTGGVPTSAVAFLLTQACPGGGFRLFLATTACTSDAVIDPDATAIAVQALSAAESTTVPALDAAREAERREALAAALDWLEGAQLPDGSFGLAPPSQTPNTNTTGLAAHALANHGRQAPADAATAWIVGQQLSCTDRGAARADAGAIAYSAEALSAARESGITPVTRDQFRRATAQALLAFGAADLGSLRAEPGAPPPTELCPTLPTSTTTTSTPAPSSTTSAPSTTTVVPSPTTVATTASSTPPTPPTTTPAAVAGRSEGRSSGSSGGRALAATGTTSGVLVAFGAAALATGLFLVRRPRRP